MQPLIFKKKQLIFYSQYLLAGRRWRQPDDWSVRWDGPECYGSRGKNEDPCQREEEGSTDGLDKEVRAVQQLLRRSLARTRTRLQRRELFGAPGVDGFLHRCFSFIFDCERWKKGFFFLHSKPLQCASRLRRGAHWLLKVYASPNICAGNEWTLTHLPLFSSLFLLFCLFPETFFSQKWENVIFLYKKKLYVNTQTKAALLLHHF